MKTDTKSAAPRNTYCADEVQNATNEQLLFTTRQAARIMGYTNPLSFLRVVHAEGIPHIRLNKARIMFTREGLDAFIKSRTIGGAAR
jgi:hypothetical protein